MAQLYSSHLHHDYARMVDMNSVPSCYLQTINLYLKGLKSALNWYNYVYMWYCTLVHQALGKNICPEIPGNYWLITVANFQRFFVSFLCMLQSFHA
jgi:hypothetical protein